MTDFESELENCGYVVFTNKGVSMMPLLRQDKDVMVIRAKHDGFKKNDAVLFRRENGQYILHRIRRVMGEEYFIIGDNCTSGEIVKREMILGILESVKRSGKEKKLSGAGYGLYVHTLGIRRFLLKIKNMLVKEQKKFFLI